MWVDSLKSINICFKKALKNPAFGGVLSSKGLENQPTKIGVNIIIKKFCDLLF